MAKGNDVKRERLTGIPAESVDVVVAQYTAEGAGSITKVQEPDGTWTVEVTMSR